MVLTISSLKAVKLDRALSEYFGAPEEFVQQGKFHDMV